MWDQLGNEPSPSINEAKSEIKLELKLGRFKKYKISDNSLNKIIDFILDQGEVKRMFEASLSAWYNYTREEVIKRCHTKIIRLDHNMRILRIQVRFIGKMKILWNNTVEKLYLPDSIFVQECCKKYENILQGKKILPPLPPEYTNRILKKCFI